MTTNRIERIREMEERMDRIKAWTEAMGPMLGALTSVQADIRALSDYYESDLWRKDFEADEAGALPADMKRGVLSEDGLYDLLGEAEELLRKLREIGETDNRQTVCERSLKNEAK